MAILGIEGISLGDMSSHFKTSPLIKEEKTESFSSVLSSMMNSIDETNSLQNKAEEEEKGAKKKDARSETQEEIEDKKE